MERNVLKLFLVGNGFDLAHGLKTSYQDFILWYFFDAIKKSKEAKGIYSDELLELKCDTNISHVTSTTNDRQERLNFLKQNIIEDEASDRPNYNNPNYSSSGIDMSILVKYKKFLMPSMMRDFLEYGWVDIEYIYYLELEKCLKNYYVEKDRVEKLHRDLIYVKDLLSKYINSLERANQSRDLLNRIRRIVAAEKGVVPNVLYVNFNYTATIYKYVNELEASSISVVNIHGLVENDNTIFGYGDENSHRYKEIENLNDNRFLEYAKSPNYSLNGAYKEMHAAIESCDKFDIIVLGHSCGLSDRTLLSELFGHEKLDTLMLSYFKRKDGTDNFLELVYNASRCFPDKTRFRKKLIEKEQTIPFP